MKNNKYTDTYQEPYRPQFHFSPSKNWMNDPNGLVFFEGEYHLFYQHNPHANTWGHMSWGHAYSHDLVSWKHLPVALEEEDDTMIFSGCVVVDKENSSGFSGDNQKPMVAIYTGHNIKTGIQTQCLAYSTDRGRMWTKYPENPVLDIASISFRDPKVFWHKETGQWIMVVALADDRKVHFYNSPNLKQWNFLSEFGPAAAVNGVWECPDLFPFKVKGQSAQIKWLLKVDLAEGAQYGGSGGQYFIGDFDGKKFISDDTNEVNWIDQGKDFYAAMTFANMNSKRCIWVGWLANWQYAEKIPTKPWKNLLTVPRELDLSLRKGKFILTQNPVKELKKLRYSGLSLRDRKLSGIQSFPDDICDERLLEIEAEFEWINGKIKEFGFELFSTENHKLVVGFSCTDKKLYIDRNNTGMAEFHPEFPGVHYSKLTTDLQSLTLHIFCDNCSIEIFVNNGESVFTELIFPLPGNFKHKFFANGSVTLKSINMWHLKPIWNR